MDCIDRIMHRFQDVDRPTAQEMLAEAQNQRDKLAKKISDNARQEQALVWKMKEATAQEKALAYANKRAIRLNLEKRLDLYNFAMNTFKGREWEAFPAILGGSARALEGSRKSADATQAGLRGYYLGGLLSDLTALGDGKGSHLKILQSGKFDRDIARVLWSFDNPNAMPVRRPMEALDIAKVIHKWQEKARTDANRAGAYIGKEAGYIVRQSHDPAKMRKAGGSAWVDSIMDKLDWERTGKGALETIEQRREFLSQAFDNITLARKKGESNPLAFSANRIGSTAARMSKERVLHFKDADAWYDYNLQYGRGNMREAILHGLSNSANNTGLMRVLGPSPQATIDAVFNMVETTYRDAGKGDAKGIEKLHGVRRHTNNIMKEVDGTLNAESYDHPTLASVGRGLRAFKSITSLGGVLLSSLSDAPNFAGEMAYQGHGYFSALGKGIVSALQGRGTAEQRRILSSMGVFADAMIGDIAARVSGEDGPGAMAKMQDTFFKLNGLSWWTDSWRKAGGLMMSHDLSHDIQVDWKNLNNKKRRLFAMYNIGKAEFDLMKKGTMIADDGKNYLTPEIFDTVSDKDLAAYLAKRGTDPSKISPERLADERDRLADHLRTMLKDRINTAVLEPDAKTKAIMRQGTSAGTVTGELARFITQFKAFPVAFIQKTLGRDFKGTSSKAEAVTNLARTMGMMTIFGMLSMTLKDLVKGKTPRDPKDPKTWQAAFIQGGGAGLYGDFIFGDYNRFGGSFAESAMGPVAGTVGDFFRIWARAREGDNVEQSLARFVQSNIPGASLFYVRGALDYLVMYNLFEQMKPGYFRRMQRRVKRENNQEFFMKPVKWW